MTTTSPRKRFGQNFLHDREFIDNIISAISLSKDDHLVEIGPGLGALTKMLLNIAARFDLIEIDRDLIPKLKEICSKEKSCFIHQCDVLEFDFKSIFIGKKMRLVGNLPYNISTPLLFHALEFKDYIEDMHFMLQREVAERITASPNTRDYGRLSIMVQYHCEAEILFHVPNTAFYPIPKVESSFIRLIPRKTYPHPVKNWKTFENIVREAFNHRRKTIQNCLKKFLSKDDFLSLNIDPIRRPEQLSIEEFVRITNFIAN